MNTPDYQAMHGFAGRHRDGQKFSEYGRDDLLYINDRVMAFLQGNKNDPFVALVDAANSGGTRYDYYGIQDGPDDSGRIPGMPERLREAMTREQQNQTG